MIESGQIGGITELGEIERLCCRVLIRLTVTDRDPGDIDIAGQADGLMAMVEKAKAEKLQEVIIVGHVDGAEHIEQYIANTRSRRTDS